MELENREKKRNKTRVLILYDSLFGNTKKVAMALDRGLEAGGHHVDSISVQEFDQNELTNYDIIGIGGPTHMRGLSKPMKSFFSQVKRFNLKDRKGFAFETKGSFPLAGSAGSKIERYLKRMNLEILNPLISAFVLEKEGPLEEKTLSRMEEVGLNIAEKLNYIEIGTIDNGGEKTEDR